MFALHLPRKFQIQALTRPGDWKKSNCPFRNFSWNEGSLYADYIEFDSPSATNSTWYNLEICRRPLAAIAIIDYQQWNLSWNAEELLSKLLLKFPSVSIRKILILGYPFEVALPLPTCSDPTLLSIFPPEAECDSGSMIDIHLSVVLSDIIVACHSYLENQAIITAAVKARSGILGSVTAGSNSSASEDVSDLITIADQAVDGDEASESRRKKRKLGRLKKRLGDLSMQCGSVFDAGQHYLASISDCKSNVDYIWQASALEGYASCLIALFQQKQDDWCRELLGKDKKELSDRESLSRRIIDVVQDKTLEAIALLSRGEESSALESEACIRLSRQLCQRIMFPLATSSGTSSSDDIDSPQNSSHSSRDLCYGLLCMDALYLNERKCRISDLIIHAASVPKLDGLFRARIAAECSLVSKSIGYDRKASFFLHVSSLMYASELDSAGAHCILRMAASELGIKLSGESENQNEDHQSSMGWSALNLTTLGRLVGYAANSGDLEHVAQYASAYLTQISDLSAANCTEFFESEHAQLSDAADDDNSEERSDSRYGSSELDASAQVQVPKRSRETRQKSIVAGKQDWQLPFGDNAASYEINLQRSRQRTPLVVPSYASLRLDSCNQFLRLGQASSIINALSDRKSTLPPGKTFLYCDRDSQIFAATLLYSVVKRLPHQKDLVGCPKLISAFPCLAKSSQPKGYCFFNRDLSECIEIFRGPWHAAFRKASVPDQKLPDTTSPNYVGGFFYSHSANKFVNDDTTLKSIIDECAVWTQDESHDVVVTFCNCLQIDITLKDVAIITTGVESVCYESEFVVPSGMKCFNVILRVKPMAVGQLILSAVRYRAFGISSVVQIGACGLSLSVSSDQTTEVPQCVRKFFKSSVTHLDRFSGLPTNCIQSLPAIPLLSVKLSSPALERDNSSDNCDSEYFIDLLHGEEITISLMLQNKSDQPIDVARVLLVQSLSADGNVEKFIVSADKTNLDGWDMYLEPISPIISDGNISNRPEFWITPPGSICSFGAVSSSASVQQKVSVLSLPVGSGKECNIPLIIRDPYLLSSSRIKLDIVVEYGNRSSDYCRRCRVRLMLNRFPSVSIEQLRANPSSPCFDSNILEQLRIILQQYLQKEKDDKFFQINSCSNELALSMSVHNSCPTGVNVSITTTPFSDIELLADRLPLLSIATQASQQACVIVDNSSVGLHYDTQFLRRVADCINFEWRIAGDGRIRQGYAKMSNVVDVSKCLFGVCIDCSMICEELESKQSSAVIPVSGQNVDGCEILQLRKGKFHKFRLHIKPKTNHVDQSTISEKLMIVKRNGETNPSMTLEFPRHANESRPCSLVFVGRSRMSLDLTQPNVSFIDEFEVCFLQSGTYFILPVVQDVNCHDVCLLPPVIRAVHVS